MKSGIIQAEQSINRLQKVSPKEKISRNSKQRIAAWRHLTTTIAAPCDIAMSLFYIWHSLFVYVSSIYAHGSAPAKECRRGAESHPAAYKSSPPTTFRNSCNTCPCRCSSLPLFLLLLRRSTVSMYSTACGLLFRKITLNFGFSTNGTRSCHRAAADVQPRLCRRSSVGFELNHYYYSVL